MSERPFQTPPLPPRAPDFPVVKTVQQENDPRPQEQVVNTENTDAVSDDFATRFKLSPSIYKTKVMLSILGGTLLAGLLLGIIFFGGSSAPVQNVSGLQGVIRNPEIRENLYRCGVMPENEPCVIYIVNHTREDRYAEYFFDQAVKLTGRQPYLLKIANRQYATTRIPVGHIAQIQVPRLQ
jgi:hypothetical protein